MKPIFKFNGGYGAILCHRCRIIIKSGLSETEAKNEINLLFCDECFKIEFYKWLQLREVTRNSEGRICYCGHTNRCDCSNPDYILFKESVIRGTLKLNDPNNGWKNYEKQSKRDETTDNSVD